MLRLLSDEDIHDDIVRGLRRREPTLDTVRALDVGLDHTPDPIILAWAASNERVLITGDLNDYNERILDGVLRRHRKYTGIPASTMMKLGQL
jgi:predicted nuclease of predicted toxin-antitoxin system